jgi:excisionase family DNA binding protein
MRQDILRALEREFLTADELKDRLKISKATVRRWTLQGILHVRMGGRLVRFELPDVLRWLEAGPAKDEGKNGE